MYSKKNVDWYTLESEVTHNQNQKQLTVKCITCRSDERNELTEETKSLEVRTLASPKSHVSDKRRILPSVIVLSLTYLHKSNRVCLPSRIFWSLVRNIFEH
jgi:hypothetical protein